MTAGPGGRWAPGSVAVAAAAAPVPAAATSPPPPPAAFAAALRPLEQVGRDLGAALGRDVLGRGADAAAAAGASAAGASAGGAPARCVGGGGLGLAALFTGHGEAERLAALLAALEEVFGDVDHGAAPLYSGPEMPPSFRTRQKWTAMKMTITNGNSSTWSTYHRSSVSLLISFEPSSTYFTELPNTGV